MLILALYTALSLSYTTLEKYLIILIPALFINCLESLSTLINTLVNQFILVKK